HRLPHSFPTRRSSDLRADTNESGFHPWNRQSLTTSLLRPLPCGRTSTSLQYGWRTSRRYSSLSLVASTVQLTASLTTVSSLNCRDRKSTRLNSSHVKT